MDLSRITVIENHSTDQSSDVAHAIQKRAQSIAAQLNLPLTNTNSTNSSLYQFALLVSDHDLKLGMSATLAPGPIRVDFDNGQLNFRLSQGAGRQALAKAVGVKAGKTLKIVDATAGLGKDSFLLASLGCKVIMLERDIVIHALLADGIRRARASEDVRTRETVTRLELRLGDFRHQSRDQSLADTDVVYLDPMFPKMALKARSKKEMFYLQQYLTSDQIESDEKELLAPAMALAGKRVVVKRSKQAPCLAGVSPSHVLTGSSSRFDVYMKV